MKETKHLICIGCPLGCEMEADTVGVEVLEVRGHTCPRGEDYARKEVVNPTRILTGSIRVAGGDAPLVSVKTRDAVPKGRMAECMAALKDVKVRAPVRIGDVVVENVAETGVDMVATRNVTKVRYSELHLFLDESGQFHKKHDLKLIGGVLLFGSYDRAAKEGIRNAMTGALAEIGRRYPNDLHFHKYRESNPEQGRVLADAISRNLAAWLERSGSSAYGVLIKHKHRHLRDVYAGRSAIPAERELDNRYLSMLWSLVEHCVFISEEVSDLLTDDAAIHLHIASRMYLFPASDEVRVLARSLGWRVAEDKKKTKRFRITSVLKEDELLGMFRAAMRDRWKSSRREFASAEITSLRYRPCEKYPESTPALYLADVLLGVERRRIFAESDRVPIVAQSLLPILDRLEHDHRLESLSVCQSCFDSGGVPALFAVIEDYPVDPGNPHSQNFIALLAARFAESPEAFYPLFEKALRAGEHPPQRCLGTELAKMLEAVLRQSGCEDRLAELYLKLVLFSTADLSEDAELDERRPLWDEVKTELEKFVGKDADVLENPLVAAVLEKGELIFGEAHEEDGMVTG